MKRLFFLISTLLSLFFSCNKESESTTALCTLSDASIVGKWSISKIEIGGRDTTSTIFTFFPCYKTMVTEFKSTKIVSETNSGKDLLGQACTTSIDKNWKIVTLNSKDYIIRYDGSISDTALVESFSCNTLVSTKDGIRVTMNK